MSVDVLSKDGAFVTKSRMSLMEQDNGMGQLLRKRERQSHSPAAGAACWLACHATSTLAELFCSVMRKKMEC